MRRSKDLYIAFRVQDEEDAAYTVQKATRCGTSPSLIARDIYKKGLAVERREGEGSGRAKPAEGPSEMAQVLRVLDEIYNKLTAIQEEVGSDNVETRQVHWRSITAYLKLQKKIQLVLDHARVPGRHDDMAYEDEEEAET